jgi:hypothetical protein
VSVEAGGEALGLDLAVAADGQPRAGALLDIRVALDEEVDPGGLGGTGDGQRHRQRQGHVTRARALHHLDHELVERRGERPMILGDVDLGRVVEGRGGHLGEVHPAGSRRRRQVRHGRVGGRLVRRRRRASLRWRNLRRRNLRRRARRGRCRRARRPGARRRPMGGSHRRACWRRHRRFAGGLGGAWPTAQGRRPPTPSPRPRRGRERFGLA